MGDTWPRNTSAHERRCLHQQFQRLVLAEASFALAVIAAAGFLTDFERGRDAVQTAEQARMVVAQSTNDLRVTLTIQPALWTQASVFEVYVLDADNQPVSNAREVLLRFTFLDKALGTNEVTAAPRTVTAARGARRPSCFKRPICSMT